MTAPEVLAEARRRGILLSARGDRLRYDAPVGVMQAELRAALVEHKAELLALLGSWPASWPRGRRSGPGPPVPSPRAGACPRLRGPGRLWQAFGERAGVVLDADSKRVSFFPPTRSSLGEESGPLPPPG